MPRQKYGQYISERINGMEDGAVFITSDFAFMARQKHFVLDGRDYYMDLLFFHRTLRRRGLRYPDAEGHGSPAQY